MSIGNPIASQPDMPAFEQIVFGMISVFGRGNEIHFNFKNPRDQFRFKGKTQADLVRFLRRLENMRVSPMSRPSGNKGVVETPLDLNVDVPSAIVFALPNNSNMQFSAKGDAVTRKTSAPNPNYCNLRYVRIVAGSELVLESEPFDGCKALAFFAKSPPPAPDEYKHGFDLHVDILQRSASGTEQVLPIIIDPDVRNPGGN